MTSLRISHWLIRRRDFEVRGLDFDFEDATSKSRLRFRRRDFEVALWPYNVRHNTFPGPKVAATICTSRSLLSPELCSRYRWRHVIGYLSYNLPKIGLLQLPVASMLTALQFSTHHAPARGRGATVLYLPSLPPTGLVTGQSKTTVQKNVGTPVWRLQALEAETQKCTRMGMITFVKCGATY